MNEKPHQSPSPGLNLGDIYHTLFRHKWKILIIWAIGITAAVAMWELWPAKYQSEAKLFVRYVEDNTSPDPTGAQSSVQKTGQRGADIIDSEIQILTSYDLALQVADAVGPSNILAKAGGGNDRYQAAGLIRGGLMVDAPGKSTVIQVTFAHPDRTVVQPVLNQLIAKYLDKHAQIHQVGGTLEDFFTQQTTELKNRLSQTEADLRKTKNDLGIISLEDTKKAYSDRLMKVQEDLYNAQAELAERTAALGGMTNLLNAATATNAPAQVAQTAPPSDKLEEYKRVSTLLPNLRKIEQERLLQFQPTSPRVTEIQKQIADNQKKKDQLEKDYPQLIATPTIASSPDNSRAVARMTLENELAKVRAIQSRIAVLNQQLQDIRKGVAAVDSNEGKITDLQRQRDLQEQSYRYFQANLERARLDESLGAGRLSNISVIESPTPPFKDLKKLQKSLLMVLAGSFAAGLALAFVVEMYLDRSFKRPIEIENKLGVPLFLSIPRARLNGKSLLTNGVSNRKLLAANSTNGNGANGNTSNGHAANGNGASTIAPAAKAEVGAWTENHALRSYFETLRDRLLLYFEAQNLTHSPKLVAVTSCGGHSGVSTIASGLAACLSETGEGNVLLVDMNELERGAAAYFKKGKLECGLDDALETEKRDPAMVGENLYVVSESVNNSKLPQILHRRFSNLMPKLRASDYDYIIFDMPPVSQISPTSRLARFMDMVFMVVEAEKTDSEVVKRATAMLAKSDATVGIVLNKTRNYVPRQLQQEL
ncbi:MAG TPA: Wzz/FepE/Etk N-terminal domain-containing protein [Verrucomicrobiae bacterium]|nr:Wzz/FepE/Etk N-terminal domain-containing protein [Verrucomicrobiae bacterium]